MKKYVLLFIVLFLIISGWIYKREIALTILPIALNISTPIADNQEIEWQKSDSKKIQISQILFLFWQMT